jgi:TM2 domain-containing membrane protein YozV
MSNVYDETPAKGFDWLTTLLLCIFLGNLGIHSFYTKKTGIGVAQLLTSGGCWVWTIIDLIAIINGSFRDGNGNPLVKKN